MSNQQTAVEWLVEQLETKYNINIERLSVTDKAKAMEKQQIIDAAQWDSRSISENGIRKGDKYYNETFKSE